MAESNGVAVGGPGVDGGPPPRSAEIASRGIRTADDAANFQAALIGDIMTGAVRERTANAACNSMGKLLKIVDMKQKYGGAPGDPPRTITLADPADSGRAAEIAAVEAQRAELRAKLAALDARERSDR